jgi:hypothetical protein
MRLNISRLYTMEAIYILCIHTVHHYNPWPEVRKRVLWTERTPLVGEF